MQNIYVDNLQAARAKSTMVWNAFPPDKWLWKPDEDAMHLLETVRHTHSSQLWFTNLIEQRGDVSKINMPDEHTLPYTTLAYELALGEKHTTTFYQLIESFTKQDFETITINRTDKPFTMSLSNFLLRAAYHEAHHTGQLLLYLRMLQIPRPNIWDLC